MQDLTLTDLFFGLLARRRSDRRVFDPMQSMAEILSDCKLSKEG